MDITLVAANGFTHDRRARALRWSLEDAGHDVTVVASVPQGTGRGQPLTPVPTRRPQGGGPVGAALRRIQPESLRANLHARDLERAVIRSDPALVVPTTVHAVEAAVAAGRTAGAHVVADPRWSVARDVDAVWRAPSEPERTGANGLAHHTPGWEGRAGIPELDRHAGRRLLLAYRRTDSNPGRYLEVALRRAGVDLLVETERVDTSSLPPGLDGVVFVEGPYPALDVVGPGLSVPTVFWAHHGEHHLDANVRLARRYRADHVLLAHSWHLAHRFARPVTRFPFGVPHDLIPAERPWSARAHDVSMVGAHLDGGGPYARRGELVHRARAHLGAERCAFLEGVTAAQMADAYADARIVINEYGTRHYPITMRVFEAVAAGALLLTDPVPGLDLLFPESRQHVRVREDYEAQLDELLSDPGTASIAATAAAHGRAHHTYDHRVDELLDVLASTVPSHDTGPVAPRDPLARALDADVEVQRVVQVGAPGLDRAHPDREVWTPDELGDRLVPRSLEAAVVSTDDVGDLREVLRAARRLLYVRGRARGLEDFLAEERPDAEVEHVGDVRRIDLGAPSYSIKAHEVIDP